MRQLANLEAERKERAEMHRKGNEIRDWYAAESEKLPKWHGSPPEDVFKNFESSQRREDELRTARDERLREAGIDEYDRKAKATPGTWLDAFETGTISSQTKQ